MSLARNVEMKARVADLSRLRVKVGSLAPAPLEALVQTDTFFVVPRGRLKLREFSDGSGELIFYERPDLAGPRESLYARLACSDPKAVSAVLGQRLAFGVSWRSDGSSSVIDRSRVHLDEVRGLGSFLEIEVVLGDGDTAAEGERIARELLAALGVPESALVAHA